MKHKFDLNGVCKGCGMTTAQLFVLKDQNCIGIKPEEMADDLGNKIASVLGHLLGTSVEVHSIDIGDQSIRSNVFEKTIESISRLSDARQTKQVEKPEGEIPDLDANHARLLKAIEARPIPASAYKTIPMSDNLAQGMKVLFDLNLLEYERTDFGFDVIKPNARGQYILANNKYVQGGKRLNMFHIAMLSAVAAADDLTADEIISGGGHDFMLELMNYGLIGCNSETGHLEITDQGKHHMHKLESVVFYPVV